MAKARSKGLVRLQYPMTSISNVLLVESLNFNLLLVAQLCDLGFKCIFGVDDVENLYLVDFNAREAQLTTCLITKSTMGWL